LEISQATVAQSINPPVNTECLPAFPSARYDRRMTDRLYLRAYVQLAYLVDTSLLIRQGGKLIVMLSAEIADGSLATSLRNAIWPASSKSSCLGVVHADRKLPRAASRVYLNRPQPLDKQAARIPGVWAQGRSVSPYAQFFNYGFGVVANLSNRSFDFVFGHSDKLAPMTGHIFGGNVDAIAWRSRWRSFEHGPNTRRGVCALPA